MGACVRDGFLCRLRACPLAEPLATRGRAHAQCVTKWFGRVVCGVWAGASGETGRGWGVVDRLQVALCWGWGGPCGEKPRPV